MDTKFNFSDLKPIAFVLYSIIVACFTSFVIAETMIVKNFAVFFLFISVAYLSVCFFYCQSTRKNSNIHTLTTSTEKTKVENLKQACITFRNGIRKDIDMIRKDHQQIKQLIRNATSGLTENFYNISSRIDQQQRVINNLIDQCKELSATRSAEQIRLINQFIKDDAGNCIRALQFEDIVSQISDHGALYLDDIEKYLGNLQSLLQIAESGDPFCSLTGEDRKAPTAMDSRMDKYQQENRTNIVQKDLSAGNIELF